MSRLGLAANVATTVLATLVAASIAYAGATGLRYQRTAAVPHPIPTGAASLGTPPPAPTKPPAPPELPSPTTKPGGPLAVDQYLLDSTTGWMLVSDCGLYSSGSCRYATTATSDGGKTWTRPVQVGAEFAANDGDAPRRVVFEVNKLDGFVYGHESAYVTHDAGKTWSPLGVTAAFFSGLAVGGSTAWVVTYPCAKGQACQFEVRSSADGGRTWSAAHKLPSGFAPDQPVPFPGGVAISSVPLGDIELTIDSGVTWRSIKSQCADNPFRAYVATPDGAELWELCHGTPSGSQVLSTSLFLSEDGGRTWSALHPSLLIGGNLPLWLDSAARHSLLASGLPVPIITHDSGSTWSQIIPFYAFSQIFSLTPTSGLAMDSNRGVWQTTDGGDHWDQVGSLPGRLS